MSRIYDTRLWGERPMGFWDGPDGEHPKEKLISVWKTALRFGAPYGLLCANHANIPLGSNQALIKVIRTVFYFGGVGTVFICSTFIISHLRDTTDGRNGALAGLCTVPALRVGLPLQTVAGVAPLCLWLIVVLRRMNKNRQIEIRHTRGAHPKNYGFQGFIWSHNKPVGEPFIKYKSNDLFTIAQR